MGEEGRCQHNNSSSTTEYGVVVYLLLLLRLQRHLPDVILIYFASPNIAQTNNQKGY